MTIRLGARRIATRLLATVAVLGSALAAGPAAGQAPDPCHDPGDAAYSTHACKVTRLRERPWVVIATVDTGINPYHVDFRLPPDDDLQGVHPSEFIEGYPAQTRALQLSFDRSSLSSARAADASRWSSIKPGEMTWIPGTNIIGALHTENPMTGDFFDLNGHGTGVASITGGRLYGQGGPNALIVSVNGSGGAGSGRHSSRGST